MQAFGQAVVFCVLVEITRRCETSQNGREFRQWLLSQKRFSGGGDVLGAGVVELRVKMVGKRRIVAKQHGVQSQFYKDVRQKKHPRAARRVRFLLRQPARGAQQAAASAIA